MRLQVYAISTLGFLRNIKILGMHLHNKDQAIYALCYVQMKINKTFNITAQAMQQSHRQWTQYECALEQLVIYPCAMSN